MTPPTSTYMNTETVLEIYLVNVKRLIVAKLCIRNILVYTKRLIVNRSCYQVIVYLVMMSILHLMMIVIIISVESAKVGK